MQQLKIRESWNVAIFSSKSMEVEKIVEAIKVILRGFQQKDSNGE